MGRYGRKHSLKHQDPNLPHLVFITDHAVDRFIERAEQEDIPRALAESFIRKLARETILANRLDPIERNNELGRGKYTVAMPRQCGVYRLPKLYLRLGKGDRSVGPYEYFAESVYNRELYSQLASDAKSEPFAKLGDIVDFNTGGPPVNAKAAPEPEQPTRKRGGTAPKDKDGRFTKSPAYDELRTALKQMGKSLSEVAKDLGFASRSGLYHRINNGWSVAEALTKPTEAHKRPPAPEEPEPKREYIQTFAELLAERGQTIEETAQELGYKTPSMLYKRVRVLGWTPEEALDTPKGGKRPTKQREEAPTGFLAETPKAPKPKAEPVKPKVEPVKPAPAVTETISVEQTEVYVLAIRVQDTNWVQDTTWEHRAIDKADIQAKLLQHLLTGGKASDFKVFTRVNIKVPETSI